MRWLFTSLVAATTLTGTLSGTAAADEQPALGPHDIATLFFINKSDDKNRVDYGIHLDESCVPVAKDAVFPYWRVFEHAPPVRTCNLNALDRLAYGISTQRLISRSATGAQYYLRLKAIHRELYVTTTKEADGRCTAVVHTAMASVEHAELLSAYVKLRRPLSVEYLDIHGREHGTGLPIHERINQ